MLRAAVRAARLPQHTRAVARAARATSVKAQNLAAAPLLSSSRGALVAAAPRGGLRWFSADAKDAKVEDAKLEDATLEQLREVVTEDAEAMAGVAGTMGAEKVVGTEEKMGFKAETQQLLDIVTHSLYTDKEVFVRELVSNASDALEKARHASLVASSDVDIGTLEVRISVDSATKRFAIQDTGIGMTRQEMADNLGTIAKSGSKAFVKEMAGKADSGSKATEVVSSIIGKFGVGFYASFMVAEQVTVYSRKRGEATGHCWKSGGDGTFTIAEADGVDFGTKVVLQLRDDCKEYAGLDKVKQVLKKHSSFVSFPVTCNGTVVNDVSALWVRNASEVTEEEHTALYRHIATQYDEPMFHLMYKADAPLDIKSVFYVPGSNSERFGMKQMPAGVHLYCRRVLIQRNAPDILPAYLSWIAGVVDSEDLPLSISRETMQDQRLMANLKSVLTKRVIKWLGDEAKNNPLDYHDFYEHFGYKIKEGVASDRMHAATLANLLRYPTSATKDKEACSFTDYIDRMKEGQDTIYYLHAADRRMAETSPYFEAFKRGGIEVMFCYHEHDEVVLGNLGKFKDKNLASIETTEPPAAFMEAAKEEKKKEEGEEGKVEEKKAEEGPALTTAEGTALVDWMRESLGTRVSDVEETSRLVDSPAIVSEHDNAVTRRMMAMEEFKSLGVNKVASYKLQVNLKHPLLKSLHEAKAKDEAVAKMVAEQLLDNAILSAGILDGARDMIPRIIKLMQAAMGTK